MDTLSENVRQITLTSSSTVPVVVAPYNKARQELFINNASTSILYILFGPGVVSATNYSVVLPANTNGVASLIEDKFCGQVTAIWASANGFLYGAEVSA